MFCNKCGKEIPEGEQFCQECKGKNKKGVSKNLIAIIIILILAAVVLWATYLSKNAENPEENQQEIEQIGASGQISNLAEASFANMKASNSNLNEEQKEVLEYFSDNYFWVGTWNYEDLQRYPKIYKEAQINLYCRVEKILELKDDEFKVLVNISDEDFIYEADSRYKAIVKGKQLDERLIVGDAFTLYGTFNDVETYEDNLIPVVDTIDIVREMERRFDLDTITTVAKYIFGNDIKIRKPVDQQDFVLGENYNPQDYFYLVTLDNQSNVNFKAFDFHQDYSATQMSFIIDNDLYLIDLKTEKNIIEPVLVGEKIRVIMLSDGILLLGNNNKDAIMKVDYKGKIISKLNADTEMTVINNAITQIVNGKMVICLQSYADNLNKYIVLNNDGTIDMSTKDSQMF